MATPAIGIAARQGPAFGFLIIAVYLFMLYSRVHDTVYYLRLPLIIQVMAIIAFFLSGNMFVALASRLSFYFVGLTMWMVVCVPFSVWPGGALGTVRMKWLQWLLLYFLIVGLIATIRQVRIAVWIIALGIVIGTYLTMRSSIGNRLAMNNAGRFSDPNDLAQFLLIGMCLLTGFLLSKPKPKLYLRLLLLGCILFQFVSFVRTGSRGGFIGLLCIIGFFFFKGTIRQKVATVFAGAIMIGGILLFASPELRARYLYIFGQFDEVEILSASTDGGHYSAMARKDLFKKSVELTLKNPVFGVGPGMFAVAENTLATNRGAARGSWHETHNMYTQVSSETGIPGLIFFLTIFFSAISRLNYISKLRLTNPSPKVESAATVADSMRLAIFSFMTTGLFLSSAYSEIYITLVGITLALERAVNRELDLAQAATSRKKAAAASPMLTKPATGLQHPRLGVGYSPNTAS